MAEFTRGIRRKTFDFMCSWRFDSTGCANEITRRGPYSTRFLPNRRRKTSCDRSTLLFSCAEIISREGYQVSLFHSLHTICEFNQPAQHNNMLLSCYHFSAATNKAETISRRLSVFMQLIPGITQLILSPSMQQAGAEICFTISSQTIVASELLKEILSMLSLSIQSLYGSKKGGLLTAKPGSNEATQRNRAKTLFVEAAKEYAPIMLQVASMLENPITTCRKENSRAHSSSSNGMTLDKGKDFLVDDEPINGHQPRTVERKRTDSTDRDWVDVHSPEPADGSSGIAPPQLTIPKNESIRELHLSGQKCLNNLISCQDVAFYAVSRLVAQAMKYGGGEASTAVWRAIISSLSFEDDEENEATPSHANINGQFSSTSTIKPGKTWSKETLCHVVALVRV